MTNISPSPTLSIIIFVVITLLYFTVKYLTSTHSIIYFIIYILALIFAEFGSNLQLTNTLCGSPQIHTVLIVTLVPWLIIFGLLNIALISFPGWLIPFSNTFGYGIAKLAKLQEAFNNVLKDKEKTNNKELSNALEDIYRDPSLLINEIPNSTIGFDKFWEESRMGGILQTGVTDENKENLRSKVKLKNIVAEFLWYLLTGLLTLSASYNYIIKSACTHSVKEMEEKHSKYEDLIKTEDEQSSVPDRVYSSYE